MATLADSYVPGNPDVRGDSSNRSLDEQLGDRAVPAPGDKPRARRRRRPPAEKPTVGEIKARYDRALMVQAEDIQNYWLNQAFLQDHQWLWFNKSTNRIDQIPRESPDRVQVVVNRMRPASRTIVSKLVSRELRFDVMPDAADDATIRGSTIAESVLMSAHHDLDWERQREDAIWATWKGATAVIAVEWDPSAGVDLGFDEETEKQIGTGEVSTSVHPIPEFVIEPGARNAKTARWWIRSVALPPEDVQALYQLEEKPAADPQAWSVPGQRRTTSTHSESLNDLTRVLTYYERPNWLCPEGYVCVIVGDEFVEGPYDWPFPFRDRLNIAVLRETQVEGRWNGDTVLNAARPVQVALNASWSSIIEHVKLAGNARLAIPASSADLLDTLTDLPAEMIIFPDGSVPPAFVSPPSMPDWWKEQPQRLEAELDDILGTHEISRGEAPAGVESGYGLTILAEQDATPLGRMTKEQALAWGEVATMVLELYEAKSRETRKAVIHQPGMPAETVAWTGKDLMGQTRAVVPLDAVIPYSRAQMQMFAEKAMQMGLLKTADQWAKLAMAPNQRDLLEVALPDVAKARRENHIMAGGEIALPAPFDDHNAHVTEHNTFRKSVRYDLLDEEAKTIFELHIQGHATLSAEELGEQYQKSLHNPLIAAAANPKGAPSLSVPEAQQAQKMLESEPGGAVPPVESPGGAGPTPGPQPGEALPGGGAATSEGNIAPTGPELGPPTAGFPGGIPLPVAGGNF